MRLKARKLACVLLAVVFLGLGARLVAYTIGTETGWGTLASHWREGLWGWVGDRRPVTFRSGGHQAGFWLRTVEKVLARHPDDAELHMAAAVILHSADWDIFLPKSPYSLEIDSVARPTNLTAVKQETEKDAYEKICDDRAQELARRATELASNEMDYWRTRATMLLPRVPSVHTRKDDKGPRDRRWESILDEAAIHDPENALYDLLAAQMMYQEATVSFKIDWRRTGRRVEDQERYEEAHHRFDRGVGKTHFTPGHGSDGAVRRFLQVAGLAPTDLPWVKWDRFAEDRQILTLPHDLPRKVWQWQSSRLIRDIQAGDVEAMLDRYRHWDQAAQRFDSANIPISNHFSYQYISFSHAQEWMALNVWSYMRRHPEHFSSTQTEEINRLVHQAKRNQLIDEKAREAMSRYPTGSRNVGLTERWRPMLILVEILPWMIVPLLLLGGVGVGVGRTIAPSGTSNPRSWMPLGLFGLSLFLTVLVLGILPAKTTGQATLRWMVGGVVGLSVTALFCFWLWLLLRSPRGQFRLSTLLTTITLIAIPMWAMTFWNHPGDLTIFKSKDIYPHPSFHLTRIVARRPYLVWPWEPSLQWISNQGPRLTVGLWLAMVIVWCRLRRNPTDTNDPAENQSDLDQPGGSFADRWGPPLQRSGRAAILIAITLLLPYLVFAPNVVREIEWNHQMLRLEARTSARYEPLFQRRRAAILQSPSALRQIEIEARKELKRTRELWDSKPELFAPPEEP